MGGTASVLGGGKFANGAVTGAFSYVAGRTIGKENRTQKPGSDSDILRSELKVASSIELRGLRSVRVLESERGWIVHVSDEDYYHVLKEPDYELR